MCKRSSRRTFEGDFDCVGNQHSLSGGGGRLSGGCGWQWSCDCWGPVVRGCGSNTHDLSFIVIHQHQPWYPSPSFIHHHPLSFVNMTHLTLSCYLLLPSSFPLLPPAFLSGRTVVQLPCKTAKKCSSNCLLSCKKQVVQNQNRKNRKRKGKNTKKYRSQRLCRLSTNTQLGCN